MDDTKNLASAKVYSDGVNATVFYLWEPTQEPPKGWALAGTLCVVADNKAKGWRTEARATDKKWQVTMEQAIPHFNARVQELIDELNRAGLGLKDLPKVVALANTPEFMNKPDSKNETLLRLQMLARDSRIMAWAYYRDSTDSFLLLPDVVYGTPAFDAAQKDAAQKGARLVAVVAWMKEAGPGGEALFGYEVMPGGSEEIAQRAKDVFREKVTEAGIQSGELILETGHS